MVDLNIRTVQKIEAGELNVLLTTVLRMQRALGCRWEDLMPTASGTLPDSSV
jgi:DNA-binding XRE family transcriptional regulator